MPFNWEAFLNENRIEYASKSSEIKLRCPFCLDDPSQHMIINLAGKGWKCWRNREHSGRSPVRLIQALLQCDWQHAYDIAGYDAQLLSDDFIGQVRGLMVADEQKRKTVKQPLTMPSEFKQFTGLPSSKPFVAYLARRGFTHPPNSLRYCTKGAYHGRIIFPIYDNKKLVCWTGRSIYSNEELRYKTLSPDEDKATYDGYSPAVEAITHYLLFQDELQRGGKALFICEGPFDALKINLLAQGRNIQATCLFTSAMSAEQAFKLEELAPRFSKLFFMLDHSAYPIALRICSQHSFLGLIPVLLPAGVKDPGELDQAQFDDLVKKHLQ